VIDLILLIFLFSFLLPSPPYLRLFLFSSFLRIIIFYP